MPDDFTIDHGLLPLTSEAFIDISERQLIGNHNVVNIFLSASLALRLGVWAKMLSTILPTIPALPHRLQQISDHDGKVWIDDSKSTTAQSLYAALQAFAPRKVYLIAGWKDKGDAFLWLVEKLSEHCEQCVAIGETKSIFLQACHDAFVPATSVSTMKEAVHAMAESTVEWDIILLSPGCSSLDMFQDYEDRARHFAAAIHASE
jgi:UDP-N-acetylmuramoylalanine--D-glutamate ligase